MATARSYVFSLALTKVHGIRTSKQRINNLPSFHDCFCVSVKRARSQYSQLSRIQNTLDLDYANVMKCWLTKNLFMERIAKQTDNGLVFSIHSRCYCKILLLQVRFIDWEGKLRWSFEVNKHCVFEQYFGGLFLAHFDNLVQCHYTRSERQRFYIVLLNLGLVLSRVSIGQGNLNCSLCTL